jgi:hypothetical protein
MFALRVNLSYQHIKMGVASLSREARPFVLRVILTINKSQIKMGVASLSREAGHDIIDGQTIGRATQELKKNHIYEQRGLHKDLDPIVMNRSVSIPYIF